MRTWREVRHFASHKFDWTPAAKNNNIAYQAFGKYCMQFRELLNYRLKYSRLKDICCICQLNELERENKRANTGLQ